MTLRRRIDIIFPLNECHYIVHLYFNESINQLPMAIVHHRMVDKLRIKILVPKIINHSIKYKSLKP